MKTIILAGLLSMSSTVWGWGLLKGFTGQNSNAFLMRTAIQDKKLSYCLEIVNDENLLPESIAFQIELAIKAWMAPLKDAGFELGTITKTNCSDKAAKLRVFAGKLGGNAKRRTPGHMEIISKGDETFSKVVVDTEWEQPRLKNYKTYRDIRVVLADVAKDYKDQLKDLVFNQNLSVRDWAISQGYVKGEAALLTFPLLLHEIGHAFGLCDTYEEFGDLPGTGEKGCDSKHASVTQSPSVMKSGEFFSPGSEDRESIKEAYKVTLEKIKSDEKAP